MPFGNETVCGKRAMQRAGRNSIRVWQISPRNRPQAREIEIGILCHQGIESPLDEGDSAGQGVFPLIKLQPTAYPAIPVTVEDGCHMRMQKRFARAPSCDRQSESDKLR